jgi:anaerobic C4-dicarboxylate transporter
MEMFKKYLSMALLVVLSTTSMIRSDATLLERFAIWLGVGIVQSSFLATKYGIEYMVEKNPKLQELVNKGSVLKKDMFEKLAQMAPSEQTCNVLINAAAIVGISFFTMWLLKKYNVKIASMDKSVYGSLDWYDKTMLFLTGRERFKSV